MGPPELFRIEDAAGHRSYVGGRTPCHVVLIAQVAKIVELAAGHESDRNNLQHLASLRHCASRTM